MKLKKALQKNQNQMGKLKITNDFSDRIKVTATLIISYSNIIIRKFALNKRSFMVKIIIKRKNFSAQVFALI